MWLILFFPVGLILMWKGNKFTKKSRIIITAMFSFLVIINLITEDSETDITSVNNTNTEQENADKEQEKEEEKAKKEREKEEEKAKKKQEKEEEKAKKEREKEEEKAKKKQEKEEEKAKKKQEKEEEKAKKKQEKEEEKAKKEREKADKKQEKEDKNKKVERAEKQWPEFKNTLLEHYKEFNVLNIVSFENFEYYNVYVPNEFKLMDENEKQYYVEEIAPLIKQDLENFFKPNFPIIIEFTYEDGRTMASKGLTGSWKIK